jgi:hypothetical protein
MSGLVRSKFPLEYIKIGILRSRTLWRRLALLDNGHCLGLRMTPAIALLKRLLVCVGKAGSRGCNCSYKPRRGFRREIQLNIVR